MYCSKNKTHEEIKNMVLNEVQNDNCSICLDSIKDQLTLENCKHSFCKNCISEWVITSKECPNCRTELTLNERKDCIFTCLINKKLILITIYNYDLRNNMSEEDFIEFSEIDGLVYIENYLYNRHDFEYLLVTTIKNKRIHSLIMDIVPKEEMVIVEYNKAKDAGYNDSSIYYKLTN